MYRLQLENARLEAELAASSEDSGTPAGSEPVEEDPEGSNGEAECGSKSKKPVEMVLNTSKSLRDLLEGLPWAFAAEVKP